MALQLSNANCVHVWHLPLDRTDMDTAAIAETLSTEELALAARFRFAADRQTFMVVHTLLRRILALYSDCSAAELSFHHGSNGKPVLANGGKLHFNLSRADKVAMLGVASQEIGVDVERFRPDFAWRPIAHHFFSEVERRHVESVPESMRSGSVLPLLDAARGICQGLRAGRRNCGDPCWNCERCFIRRNQAVVDLFRPRVRRVCRGTCSRRSPLFLSSLRLAIYGGSHGHCGCGRREENADEWRTVQQSNPCKRKQRPLEIVATMCGISGIFDNGLYNARCAIERLHADVADLDALSQILYIVPGASLIDC